MPLSQAEEALIGDITKINLTDTLLAIFLGLIVFVIINRIYQKMILSGISEDLAKTERIDVKKYNLIYLICITLIVALFGYIAWDRRTMMKPVLERVERIEQDVAQNFDLSNTDDSKLSRLIDAMRELARTDERLATILRSFSLL